MDAHTVSVEIKADRRLVIDVPADVPLGHAEVIILSHLEQRDEVSNPAREAARAKLLAGGALNTSHHAPEGAIALSNEELEKLGQLTPGARSSEALLDEDRGTY